MLVEHILKAWISQGQMNRSKLIEKPKQMKNMSEFLFVLTAKSTPLQRLGAV